MPSNLHRMRKPKGQDRDLHRLSVPCGLGLISAVFAGCIPPAGADDSWRVNAGPGLVITPQYPGSKGERSMPLPMLDIAYGQCLFLSTGRGLGAYFVNRQDWQIGSSLWFRRGRHHDEGAKVTELGDIGTAAEAQLFANYNLGPAAFGATLAKDLGGSDGLTLDASADWRLPLSARVQASLGAESSFGSSRYMQTWFGVTPDQARASGLAEYSPGAGFRSAGPTASLNYVLTRRWTFSARVADDFLIGKAANSPVIDRKAMPMAAIGVTYRFLP